MIFDTVCLNKINILLFFFFQKSLFSSVAAKEAQELLQLLKTKYKNKTSIYVHCFSGNGSGAYFSLLQADRGSDFEKRLKGVIWDSVPFQKDACMCYDNFSFLFLFLNVIKKMIELSINSRTRRSIYNDHCTFFRMENVFVFVSNLSVLK